MADTDQTPDPAAEKLAFLRSRHYRIPDPAIAGNEEGICASDRHRWPCHAATLLGAAEAVLKLVDEAIPSLGVTPAGCTDACDSGSCDCSGQGRTVAWNLDPAKVREAITRELTKGEAGDE